MQVYGKFFVALLGTAALALVGFLSDSRLTSVETVQVVVLCSTAAAVWLRQNNPLNIAAKTSVAVVGGVATFLVGTIADGVSGSDWSALVVVALTAAGVFVAPSVSTPAQDTAVV